MESIRFDPALKAPDGTASNQFPFGWRAIDEKALSHSLFFYYFPTMIERRLLHPEGEQSFEAFLYWFHDKSGIAFSRDYWKGTVKYFAFGCPHQYVELSKEECETRGIYHAGNCYHVEECKLCKGLSSRDSSD